MTPLPALTLLSLAAGARKNVLFFAVDDLRVQLGVESVPGTPKMCGDAGA